MQGNQENHLTGRAITTPAGIIGGASASSISPPAAISSTETRLGNLCTSQNVARNLLEDLETSLAPVLSVELNAAPKTAVSDQPKAMPPSPLCAELDHRIDAQASLNERVASLIQRLTI